jgi:hypothetical protein
MSQPRFCNNFDVAVCFPARNPIILLPRCSFYFRHTSGIRLAVIRTSLVHNQQPDPFALVSLTPSTIHNESSTRHSISSHIRYATARCSAYRHPQQSPRPPGGTYKLQKSRNGQSQPRHRSGQSSSRSRRSTEQGSPTGECNCGPMGSEPSRHTHPGSPARSHLTTPIVWCIPILSETRRKPRSI